MILFYVDNIRFVQFYRLAIVDLPYMEEIMYLRDALMAILHALSVNLFKFSNYCLRKCKSIYFLN